MSKKQKGNSSFTTQNFAIALKWKTAHTAIKNSLGENFDNTMAKTKKVITDLIDGNNFSIIDAVTHLQRHANDNVMKAIIFAAGYELYLEK